MDSLTLFVQKFFGLVPTCRCSILISMISVVTRTNAGGGGCVVVVDGSTHTDTSAAGWRRLVQCGSARRPLVRGASTALFMDMYSDGQRSVPRIQERVSSGRAFRHRCLRLRSERRLDPADVVTSEAIAAGTKTLVLQRSEKSATILAHGGQRLRPRHPRFSTQARNP